MPDLFFRSGLLRPMALVFFAMGLLSAGSRADQVVSEQDFPDGAVPEFRLIDGTKFIVLGGGDKKAMCARLTEISRELANPKIIFGQFLNNVYFEDQISIPKPFVVDSADSSFKKYFLRQTLANVKQDSKNRDKLIRKPVIYARENMMVVVRHMLDVECAQKEDVSSVVTYAASQLGGGEQKESLGGSQKLPPPKSPRVRGAHSKGIFYENKDQLVLVRIHNADLGKLCVGVCENNLLECKLMLLKDVLVASKIPIRAGDYESPMLRSLIHDLRPEEKSRCEIKAEAKQVEKMRNQASAGMAELTMPLPRIPRSGGMDGHH